MFVMPDIGGALLAFQRQQREDSWREREIRAKEQIARALTRLADAGQPLPSHLSDLLRQITRPT